MASTKAPKMPTVGTPADEVLKMRGRSTADSIRLPQEVGKDDQGMIVEWYYADITVTMHWRQGRYRVQDVQEVAHGSEAGNT